MRYVCQHNLRATAIFLVMACAVGAETPPAPPVPPGWGPEQWQATRNAIDTLAEQRRGDRRVVLNGPEFQTLRKQDPFLVMTCVSELECAGDELTRRLYCEILSLVLGDSTDFMVRREAVERLLHVQVCGLLATGVGGFLEGIGAADFNDRAKAYLRIMAYHREERDGRMIRLCAVADLQDLKPVLRAYVPADWQPFGEAGWDGAAESLALARLGDARELDRWLAAFAELPVSWDGVGDLWMLSYLRSPRAVPILARWIASDARSPYQEHAPKGVPLWPRALDALADTVDGLPIPARPLYKGYSDDERAKVLAWLKTQTTFKMKP